MIPIWAAIVAILLSLAGFVIWLSHKVKKLKRLTDFRNKQEIKFNQVVDLVISGQIQEAKDVYNTIEDCDDKRPFLNGLLIGIDLIANEQRLIENKYNIAYVQTDSETE